MFNRVGQFCENFSQEYYDQIPADGLKAIGLSAVVSLVASIIIATFSTGANQPANLSRVALAVGIGSLASVIHVLTTPIFNYIFDNPNNDFNGFQEFIRVLIDITLTQVLINHTTAFKINLITALNLQGGNFIILPHNLFKAGSDMAIRTLNVIDPGFAAFVRHICMRLGMDFNVNPTPVYMVI